MKARPAKLTPELNSLVLEEVRRKVQAERGYNALLAIQMTMWVLASEPYNWGKKRLENYWEKVSAAFRDLTEMYGYDCWIDKVYADLERVGITFVDDGWIEELKPKARMLSAEDREKSLEAFLKSKGAK